MDPFEVRMQFLHLLKGLNAQQSISKVVRYALKFFSKCGDDLWDCIVEECQKGTLNARINILYMLDSLCESSLVAYGSSQSQTQSSSSSRFQVKEPLYVELVRKDLHKLVDLVVPEGREGLANLMSTTQILQNWRTKRVFDPLLIDAVLEVLEQRKMIMHEQKPSSHSVSLSKSEITKRIEEDRERHKRLRERRWVQPIPSPNSESLSVAALPRLACFLPSTSQVQDDPTALTAEDVEFENAWENTSDWNEDDDDDVEAENDLCFPGEFIGYRQFQDDEDVEMEMDIS